MKNILISGGTGFIGEHLIEYFRAIDQTLHLTVLVRSLDGLTPKTNVSYALWDVEKQYIAPEVSTTIDTVIHLAGANVADGRWTAERKKVLLESRTKSGQLLVDWVKTKGKLVKTFISASGIGWYGEGLDGQVFTEDDASGNDFLSEVCRLWEASTQPLAQEGVRLVYIRTGLVLDPAGGMWKAMQSAFAFRVAPRFGDGQQVYSWIALQDIVRLYVFAAQNPDVHGPLNAVSPHPLTQLEVAKALVKKEGSFYVVFPIPATLLKAALGELSMELLKNAHVSAQKALSAGFVYAQPKITDL
ncbi:TIGR01777 family oxidoreductase [Sphingobacterium oryzagri]|uniref:TIGR01777 family oxidoreductase n=1 Tax=Sphingobacterium oryzagri TaxID=3025669 RepID=A0ABY7WFX7_9SPHI|nr:TIGR01777 family oxidoreductase [Sphingobacterium sp. KACC 22765]WDF67436.1 TIGR01777 family oxidoreductase [Sphingobacterium sp. KACC 22765]